MKENYRHLIFFLVKKPVLNVHNAVLGLFMIVIRLHKSQNKFYSRDRYKNKR